MQDPAHLSATELTALLRERKISSLELTDHYIARIEASDSSLNAVVVKDYERAREAARKADSATDRRGPLHGLPMTIKESYNIAGLPTTWGVPAFRDNIATNDAEMVKRYRAAGAHFMGKTNVPLNLADFQSYNEIYGTSANPWDTRRTPGGSSGGSAIAMAAGLSGLESGSDIGGSIRNPAHYCGVYGHKPTWGTVPPQGHALPGALASPDVAVCGPLARSAPDLALAMDIIAGAEPLNAPGWRIDLPRPQHKRLADYRVAIWASDELAAVDDEIQQRTLNIGERLETLGARVSFEARPDIDMAAAHLTYLNLMQSIMGAASGGAAFEEFQRRAAQLDPADMTPEAITIRAMTLSHRGWLQANNRREKLRYRWRDFFRDWDILICPQSATTAFPHDHTSLSQRVLTINGEVRPYFEQLFWAGFVGCAFLPSTVFPTGPSDAGLPIGLQAISAEYNDYVCIDFARLLAQEIGGFQAPPDYETV